MKYLKTFSIGILITAFGISQVGCYGSFALTKKLYSWNTSLGDKFVNEVVFLVFIILPVYGATVFLDGIILNSIEFWTGSSPISMNEGDKEHQVVKMEDGQLYSITATPNRFDVVALTGDKKGLTQSLVYSPEDRSWSIEAKGNTYTLTKIHEDNSASLFFPNGEELHLASSELNEDYLEKVNLDYAFFARK